MLNQVAIASAVNQFSVQATEMNGAFLERKTEVSLLQIALIAEQPLVFLGLAGTGKSQIVNTFASTLEADDAKVGEIAFYQYLLGKYTTPAEIFGIQSVKELRENDRFVLNPAGKMPMARVAFLDEVFKANSATLNSLLTILNERQYDDGSGVRKNANVELVVGASNEMPEEGEGLEALWDRFVIRHTVEDIQRDDSFISLLTGEGIGQVSCKVSRSSVLTLRELRDQVDITNIIPALMDLRQAMAEAGIRVSGRKWVKAVKVIKSWSALKGRSIAKVADIGVLSAVLWDQPDQVDAIRTMLSKFASDDVKKAMSLADSAREVLETLKRRGADVKLQEIGQAKRTIQAVLSELANLDQTEEAVSEATEIVSEMKSEISRLTIAIARG